MGLVRYVVALFIAVVVTLAAFTLMHRLIANDRTAAPAAEPVAGIWFETIEIPDEPLNPRDRVRPEREPPPDQPPRPPEVEIKKIAPVITAPIEIDRDVYRQAGVGPAPGWVTGGKQRQDGGAVVISSFPPRYPREAALGELEGYVTVRFTITEAGTVRDPEIIESHPPRVFDQEVLRAIARWRFKPMMINGVATEQTATQTLEFKLAAD